MHIEHTTCHKPNLNKCKIFKIIKSLEKYVFYSQWNDIINQKTGKSTNMWKLNRTSLNNQWVKEIKGEIKNTPKQRKMDIQHIKI